MNIKFSHTAWDVELDMDIYTEYQLEVCQSINLLIHMR